MSLTDEQFNRVSALSPEIKDYIFSQSKQEIVSNLNGRLFAAAEETGAIMRSVLKLLIKDLPPEKFIDELLGGFADVDKHDIYIAAKEIKHNILEPIKTELQDMGINIELIRPELLEARVNKIAPAAEAAEAVLPPNKISPPVERIKAEVQPMPIAPQVDETKKEEMEEAPEAKPFMLHQENAAPEHIRNVPDFKTEAPISKTAEPRRAVEARIEMSGDGTRRGTGAIETTRGPIAAKTVHYNNEPAAPAPKSTEAREKTMLDVSHELSPGPKEGFAPLTPSNNQKTALVPPAIPKKVEVRPSPDRIASKPPTVDKAHEIKVEGNMVDLRDR